MDQSISAEVSKEGGIDRQWRFDVEHADIAHYLEVHAPGKRVLDIGAGIGEMAESLSRYGFAVEGIEPSEEASERARERGLKIHSATLAEWSAGYAGEGFDAVILANVLEHVPNPENTIQQVNSLLVPGGVVVIRSPNDFSEIQKAAVEKLGIRQWWIVSPDHISYFDKATLSAMLDSNGFDVATFTCDFPIDWFLLMGEDYISNPSLGRQCHARRRQFEEALPAAVRRQTYEALAAAGSGRNLIVYAKKR
jgi:2-polyprenyl-3-methyl-5-hydroxy-6-metoxy-1,4-benzoquinol methylase